MSITGICLDRAELLSVILEALLYSFSLLMFVATIWTLLSRRPTHQVNRKMFTVACALLLFSTAHLVINIIRVVEGLIIYRLGDTSTGGPSIYFSDVSQWTFVAKNYVFTAQTVVGDGVVLYRCYVVWQSKLLMILPALLWCATVVTGIGSTYTASRVTQDEVFGGILSRWITAFWATALATNLLTTLLLVYRIWYVDRRAAVLRGHQQSQLRQVLHILVDAGVIYSLTLLVALICFLSQTNGHYVVLDMVTPIISITFYMVIIRVGLAYQANRLSNISLGYTTDDRGIADQRRRTQVHIRTLTECKVDQGRCTPMCPTSPTSRKSSTSENKFDGGGRCGGHQERVTDVSNDPTP